MGSAASHSRGTGRRWGPEEPIADYASDFDGPEGAIRIQGRRMTAVWQQEDTLRAADRTLSGDWGEPTTLVTGVRDLRSLDMAVSRDWASVVWASNHGRIR